MEIPVPCPVCGAYSMSHDQQSSALLAVCDVLVVKALEAMGRYIISSRRERYREKGTRPWYVVHTLWSPDDACVSRALKGAWDVVPAMLDNYGCCDVSSVQVTRMLDEYVHDLAITGTYHHITELAYRFETRLGLPVYLKPVKIDFSAYERGQIPPIVQMQHVT